MSKQDDDDGHPSETVATTAFTVTVAHATLGARYAFNTDGFAWTCAESVDDGGAISGVHLCAGTAGVAPARFERLGVRVYDTAEP